MHVPQLRIFRVPPGASPTVGGWCMFPERVTVLFHLVRILLWTPNAERQPSLCLQPQKSSHLKSPDKALWARRGPTGAWELKSSVFHGQLEECEVLVCPAGMLWPPDICSTQQFRGPVQTSSHQFSLHPCGQVPLPLRLSRGTSWTRPPPFGRFSRH